ncbi:unnamed protein product, partial [Staurois parvus]
QSRKKKLLRQALTSALLDTDRRQKTTLTVDEKRYLAGYITKTIALPCCVYCGRPDTVNSGSGETRYSECRGWGDQI